MQFKLRLISAVVLALFMAPQSSSAQSAPAGTRDANGRILAKVVVTMNEPGAFGRPATGLAFLLVGEDGDRVSIKTNDAGVASTWISPGEYRLVTPDPLTWDGFSYTWDRMVYVTSKSAVIQLTQNEARSIAEASFEKTKPVRTSEPAVLSSTPTMWKASSPTQDLRKTAPKPVIAEEPSQTQMNEAAPIRRPAARSRQGMWFNIGSGYGAITCAACTDAYGGFSGGLSIGGTIGSRVRLGLGTTSWYKSEDGATLLTGTVDARIRFYPGMQSGFFITGGIGAGSIGADLAGYGSGSEFGFGSVGGLGWDVPIANSVSFTPYWNFFNVTTSNTNTTVGQIGIGFTFHQ